MQEEIKNKILELYNLGINQLQISKEVGYSRNTIKKVLLKFGIDYTEEKSKLELEKRKQLVELYKQGVSQIELETRLKMTRKTIRELLKSEIPDLYREKSVALRKYQLNDDAFDNLKDEEVAYWIGFLYADGHIYPSNSLENTISLGLQLKDINHLEKFKLFLKSTSPIRQGSKKASNGNYHEYCKISIFSKKIINVLRDLGFDNNKSHTAKPHVSLSNNKHFWRGVVDGDGCLSYHSENYSAFELCGTKETIQGFIDFVDSNLFIKNKKIPLKCNGKELYDVKYYKDATQVADLLYKDSKIYLDRKYKIYQEWINTKD